MKVYFRQKDDSLSEIRNKEISMSDLRSLPDYSCIIEGCIYSKSKGENEPQIVRGETFPFCRSEFDKRLFPEEYPIMPESFEEPEEKTDAATDQDENIQIVDTISSGTDIPAVNDPSCSANEESNFEIKNELEYNNIEKQENLDPVVHETENDSNGNYFVKEEIRTETRQDNTVRKESDDTNNSGTSPALNEQKLDRKSLRERIPDIYWAEDASYHLKQRPEWGMLPDGVFICDTFYEQNGVVLHSAEIRIKTIITAINGVQIKSIDELEQQLSLYPSKEIVSLNIIDLATSLPETIKIELK